MLPASYAVVIIKMRLKSGNFMIIFLGPHSTNGRNAVLAGHLNAVHKSLIKLQWAGLQCNQHSFSGLRVDGAAPK